MLEGMLFSSHSPVLGRNLSAAVAQEMSLFERHLPSSMSATAPSSPHTSPLHFVTVGLKTYGAEALHKSPKLSLTVQPFEVLLWWPVADIFTELANAFSKRGYHGNSRVAQEEVRVGLIGSELYDLVDVTVAGNLWSYDDLIAIYHFWVILFMSQT